MGANDKMLKTCTYPGCDRKYNSKGYCASHRIMILKGQELRPILKWGEYKRLQCKICSIDGCEGKHLAKGYCGKHYQSIIEKPKRIPKTKLTRKTRTPKTKQICDIDNCDNISKAKGLCPKHYVRQLRHGSTEVNYHRRNKRTSYNINTTPLRYTQSHEEVMILNDFFDEMIGCDNPLERFE